MSMIINPYAFAGGNVLGVPTVVYAGKGSMSGNSPGATNTIDIGTASADRIVLLLTKQYADDSYVVSRTINGSTPSILWSANPGSLQYLRVLAMAIPSGTTASLFFRANASGVSLQYLTYAIYGLGNMTLFQGKSTASSTTTSTTINIPANGFALGWRFSGSGVNPPSGTTWTGLTRDTTISGGSSNTVDPSCGHFTTASAVTGRAISAATNYAGFMGVISMGNGS